MTIDNMFKNMSKFFDDPKNKAFTIANNRWWFVYIFTRTILDDNKGHMRTILSRVLDGPFGDEIKPHVKYVKTDGIPTELFPTGGPAYTPVMTIFGLQKLLMRLPKNKVSTQIRDMADKALALWIAGDKTHIESACANAASSAPIQQLYRQAIASERAAGGAGIVEPPEQVLARAWCDFAALVVTTEPFFVAVVQDPFVLDIMRKRKLLDLKKEETSYDFEMHVQRKDHEFVVKQNDFMLKEKDMRLSIEIEERSVKIEERKCSIEERKFNMDQKSKKSHKATRGNARFAAVAMPMRRAATEGNASAPPETAVNFVQTLIYSEDQDGADKGFFSAVSKS